MGSLPKERRFPVRSFCAAAGLLLVMGCSKAAPASQALRIDYEISPQPVRVGAATVTLNLYDAAKPLTGAHIALEADMSHAGMAPFFGDAREVSRGRYQAQLQLGMAGDWVILVHMVLPGGQTVDRQFDVRDVRPN